MKLPLPTSNAVPYLANQDSSGELAIPVEQFTMSGGLYLPVSLTNPLANTGVGSGANVFDGTFAFANSAAAGTTIKVPVALPSVLNKDGLYKITIINPSVTSLSVEVENKETISSTVYYPKLTTFGVNNGENIDTIIQGLFGEAAQLSISNIKTLGATEGFTGFVRIRRL